jgi:hypothetical protein
MLELHTLEALRVKITDINNRNTKSFDEKKNIKNIKSRISYDNKDDFYSIIYQIKIIFNLLARKN